MATDKTLTLYPVGNGLSMLLALDDDVHLLLDLLQRDEEEEGDKRADVRSELIAVLPERDGRSRLSVFCLSHADLDHCQGFDRVFYCPGQADEEEEDLIGIDELWVTADIFNETHKGPAKVVQQEARRRLSLWADPKKRADAEKLGNQLVVFGQHDDLDDLKKLPQERRPTAGETIARVCGNQRTDFELFVHSPFSFQLEEDQEPERNDKSLVAQVILKTDEVQARTLLGGDASCHVWKTIYNMTRKHKRLERLDWDVFVCPHHGSYRFFTETESDEGREEAEEKPAETSMEILRQGQENGWVVCPSRPVKSSNYADGNPPHKEAVKHYRAQAKEIRGDDGFVCLMEYPDKDAPKPFVVRLTDGGFQESRHSTRTGHAQQAAVVATPRSG